MIRRASADVHSYHRLVISRRALTGNNFSCTRTHGAARMADVSGCVCACMCVACVMGARGGERGRAVTHNARSAIICIAHAHTCSAGELPRANHHAHVGGACSVSRCTMRPRRERDSVNSDRKIFMILHTYRAARAVWRRGNLRLARAAVGTRLHCQRKQQGEREPPLARPGGHAALHERKCLSSLR